MLASLGRGEGSEKTLTGWSEKTLATEGSEKTLLIGGSTNAECGKFCLSMSFAGCTRLVLWAVELF